MGSKSCRLLLCRGQFVCRGAELLAIVDNMQLRRLSFVRNLVRAIVANPVVRHVNRGLEYKFFPDSDVPQRTLRQ